MRIDSSSSSKHDFSVDRMLRRCALSLLSFALAVAVLLPLPGTLHAQQPPGQPLIAHQARFVTIIQTILGQTPSSFPASIAFLTGSGAMTTYFPDGPVTTSGNPFFDTTLTTNGRSCFTCHAPPGWTISPPQIATIFLATRGKSPLFQPIDSAGCPDAPGASGPVGSAFIAARSQLFNRGNIRISINAPNPLAPATTTTFEGNNPSSGNSSTATPQWILTVKRDPTGCENDETYGLPAGTLSVYRRTMPSANIAFLNPGARGPETFNVMWDAREPSLESQFIDATEFHGQGANPSILDPLDPQEGASFQQGIFAAESSDFIAGDLTGKDGSGATGGPQNLFDGQLNVPPANPFSQGFCFDFPGETLDGSNAFCPGSSVFRTCSQSSFRSLLRPAKSRLKSHSVNRSPAGKPSLIHKPSRSTMSPGWMTCLMAAFHRNRRAVPILLSPARVRRVTTIKALATTPSSIPNAKGSWITATILTMRCHRARIFRCSLSIAQAAVFRSSAIRCSQPIVSCCPEILLVVTNSIRPIRARDWLTANARISVK